METLHPQWQAEQEHLEQTLDIIRSEQRKREQALGIDDGKDRYVLVSDDGSDDAAVQQQVMRAKLRELSNLRRSLRSPYFARLDFTPENAPPWEPVYVGRWGVLQTPEHRVCVADWRSPVANLYYSGQLGRVTYDAPDGCRRGELTLKRMFTIEDGALLAMQDTGVIGGEAFLAEALEQAATGRLREVVATIQAEQNRVIRAEPQIPLCVQGVAGSGKTTIALHRIAWVLYRLQKTLDPRQMLILAPNPLFLSYISDVLPDLGVEEVRQTTFSALCAQLLGRRMPRLGGGTRLSDRLDMTKAQRDALDMVLRCKGSLALEQELTRFLQQWERRCLPSDDICFAGSVLLGAEEMARCFLVDLRHFPLQTRIAELRKTARTRLDQRLEAARERLARRVEDKLQTLLSAMPDGPERRALAQKLFAVRDQRLDELKALAAQCLKDYDAAWGTMELLEVYGAFWQEMALRDEHFRPVLAATLPLVQKKRAAPEDLPALLLLGKGLYGLAVPDIRHVVIDEAQDMPPLAIRALRLLFGHDAFTLVGDLCQGVCGDGGLRSWDSLREGVFVTPPEVVCLGVAYRSTTEIMHAAFSVLARHPVEGAGEARPVLRHGAPPFLIRVADERERAAAVAAHVLRWLDEGYLSAAVIVKTPRSARRLHAAVRDRLPQARLTDGGEESYSGGVQIMDAGIVKGLEFDCVLVADAEAAIYPDERFYAKLFYVLCTRPLHRLGFLYRGEPAGHLASSGL